MNGKALLSIIDRVTPTQSPGQFPMLIGTTIFFPEQAREIMREVTIESRSENVWERLRSNHKNGDEQIRTLWTQFHHFKDSYDDMNFRSLTCPPSRPVRSSYMAIGTDFSRSKFRWKCIRLSRTLIYGLSRMGGTSPSLEKDYLSSNR